MTGSELKTIRESLGLSAQWCATRIGEVAYVRTWQRWEAEDVPVPQDVADKIEALELETIRLVSEAVRFVPENGLETLRYRDVGALWRNVPEMQGMPVAYHASILARVRASLLGTGRKLTIAYA